MAFTFRCLQRIRGCSFLGDNLGFFLSFPSFILPVDDSSDCIIRGSFLFNTDDAIEFDSRLVGIVTAVSDNTCFRSSRRPIQQPPLGTSQKLSSQSPSTKLLPAIPEVEFESLILSPVPLDMSSPHILPGTTMSESVLESTSPTPHPTSLSDTQLKEIISLVITNLRKHGKITPELLHALKGESYQPKRSTSTTPSNHPTLLSCDKMSNTAPQHMRFTVQQLS